MGQPETLDTWNSIHAMPLFGDDAHDGWHWCYVCAPGLWLAPTRVWEGEAASSPGVSWAQLVGMDVPGLQGLVGMEWMSLWPMTSSWRTMEWARSRGSLWGCEGDGNLINKPFYLCAVFPSLSGQYRCLKDGFHLFFLSFYIQIKFAFSFLKNLFYGA